MSSWYFWFGSADYMANDGVSMESDHFGAALFSQRWKVTESLLLYLFHSPPSLMIQELSPPTLLAIPCVFNTLLPSVFIKATYKIYASLPKIQSSSTNYSQYMNFRHEESTTFHCQSATLTLKNIAFKFYSHLATAYTSSLLGYIWHRWRHGNKKHGGEQTWCATTIRMLLYLHLTSCKPQKFLSPGKKHIWINASLHA